MTIELSDLKQPAESLRKVLGELADHIAKNIEKIPNDPADSIHDIRVSTKKIRSLLRLAKGALSKKDRRGIADILRRLKDAFSGSRDEEVMRQRLSQILPAKKAAAAARKIGLPPAENIPPANTSPLAADAAGLSRCLAALDFKKLTPGRLAKNVTACYRRARKELRKCEESATDEEMHEWRKRVKDVYYHACALGGASGMKEFSDSLDGLAESLGEYHDLALLGGRAANHKEIAAGVSRAKAKTGADCFEKAGSLFATTAPDFAKKIKTALGES